MPTKRETVQLFKYVSLDYHFFLECRLYIDYLMKGVQSFSDLCSVQSPLKSHPL